MSVRKFDNADEALQELTSRLNERPTGVQHILNTRLSRDRVLPEDAAFEDYLKAICSALRNGAKMIDVISPQYEDIARELRQYMADPRRRRGNYRYICRNIQLPCVLNFTIVDYKQADSDSELWIGWAVNHQQGMESPALQIKHPAVVECFRAYHVALRGPILNQGEDN